MLCKNLDHIIPVPLGLRIHWLNPYKKVRYPPKRTQWVSCIWWWDSSSNDLGSEEYSFIVINGGFTLTQNGSHLLRFNGSNWSIWKLLVLNSNMELPLQYHYSQVHSDSEQLYSWGFHQQIKWVYLELVGWVIGWLGFYGISTFVGYLTPNPLLYK